MPRCGSGGLNAEERLTEFDGFSGKGQMPLNKCYAALVGVLSDTLPFYHWSLLLHTISPDGRRAGLITRVPLLRRHSSLLLPLKIAAHLATFQPLSTAAYLYLQGLVRHGGSARAALAFMRARFLTAVLPALAAFAIGEQKLHLTKLPTSMLGDP